ncbi:hypothetical protein LTR37_016283 [Vermiconidia calcicola]|uniref:Uncharacterized protein n=1 Tax=Vermiconidia calcicola TaxID=1690605 RepID=A0ACC3MNC0_9PEZI|nr:hypothetical protein LTR37_016283 [Vermiconidia calcicola]
MNADIASRRNLAFDRAPQRLASLIDQVLNTVPNTTVVLVAQIIHALDAGQDARTQTYNRAIPGIVQQRANAGYRIRVVDMSVVGPNEIDPGSGGVHPTPGGYIHMGDVWANAIRNLPSNWVQPPIGGDPVRPASSAGVNLNANGGPDPNIPPPVFGTSPVRPEVSGTASRAAFAGFQVHDYTCSKFPVASDWGVMGQIAQGFGRDGGWRFNGRYVAAGKVADGLHLDPAGVRLVDMDGDGKADYVHLDAKTGRLVCWINNLPGLYAPAGNNGGVIASGSNWPRESIRLADLDGDGKADYLIIDANTGRVNVYWNGGPDANAPNGWRFIPGGVIATGVPHANWVTLQFPDINGDGRADYVIEGVGGSLGLFMNVGKPGGRDALFIAKGGIATGATSDLSKIRFADFDGDGRDDYGVIDNQGGLTGFLNIRTDKEGIPFFANQGPAKTIAEGITQPPEYIILADMDGDGKDDYVYVDRTGGSGALFLWWNRGNADTSRAMDGLYFADMNNDGLDDYIWVDYETGAPYLFINQGPSDSDPLGWHFNPINNFKPIASGAGPRATVHFADINGDGFADYCTVDLDTGELRAYLNDGPATNEFGWSFSPIGSIASGLGPGKNTRFGDIDGDGYDDYIQLRPNGGATIYRNNWDYRNNQPGNPEYLPFPASVNPSGIGQRPEDISFHDIDGDGKVDYLWTRNTDGAVFAYRNNYPNSPQWLDQGQIFEYASNSNDIISGASTRWATLQDTGRASYIQVNPKNGAIAGFMNICPAGSTVRRPAREGRTCDPKGPKARCSQNQASILSCVCNNGSCKWASLVLCDPSFRCEQTKLNCPIGACCRAVLPVPVRPPP